MKKSTAFALLLFLASCANTMNIFYTSVATAATTVSTGYQMLDAYDNSKQAAIVQQAQTDLPGAQKALLAHLDAYAKARTVLDASAATVSAANAAGPSLQAAMNRSSDVAGWIAKLVQLGVDVATALKQFNIALPGAK